MSIRFVVRQLGLLTVVLSVAIFAVVVWSAVDWSRGDPAEAAALRALAMTMGCGLAAGLLMWALCRRGGQDVLGRREALLLVALSWLVGAALAALPFRLWAMIGPGVAGDHPFHSYINCYFEAMSGLTTTGATVLSDIAPIPRGLLLWRALTQWLGGLGIVVLFVAVLPSVGVGGKRLFQVEAPGPTQQGVRPRIAETARVLWMIYLGLTVAEVLLLRVLGMDWFNSVCHTFATLATGGFSTSNASIGDPAFSSVGVHVVVICFMVLAGVNFGIYYQLIHRRFGVLRSDPELRLYLGILLIGSGLVLLGVLGVPLVMTDGRVVVHPGVADTVRHSVFQVVSIQTTTGFVTADFDLWGFVPKAVLIALMFVGASAGSTGGGIKVIRILIVFKIMIAEVERVFRPNVVRTIKVGKATVDPELRQATLVYVLGILLLFVIGAALLMLLEQGNPVLTAQGATMDFTTAATASAATLNNIGPGLHRVGAIANYGWFTPPSKLVMCLLMVLGRLEVYAIFVMFVPRFWRGE